MLVKVGDLWRFTRDQIPQRFWESLLHREGWQIGIQELLAPMLALGTWPEVFQHTLWLAWVDSQGVLHLSLSGSL